MDFFSLKNICDCPKFLRSNIIKFWTKLGIKIGYRLRLQLHSIYFLLDVNFVKFTIGLDFLLISSILAKFQKDKKSIAMLSIKFLNFKFL